MEILAGSAGEARDKASHAAADLAATLERITTETWRYNSALDKWADAVDSRNASLALREQFEGQIRDLETRAAGIAAELAAPGDIQTAPGAAEELAQLVTMGIPPRPDAGDELARLVEQVSAAENRRNAAQETAGAIVAAQRVADDLRAKQARAEAAIEAGRVVLEGLKSAAELIARLRTHAVGQAVGPFVAAVNERLGDALGELVVDLAPVARVGFRRGESLVPVHRLSGMEAARWLAACAVAAAGLVPGPCQIVLMDDLDRLTPTPRQALLELLGESVAMGDLGGAVLALAWEPTELPEGTGWDVIGCVG